ncbi:MAG: hypothetical protein M0R06_21310 [Sphaerochaeta sp.]|nr:hypothetical protein [Sphaerochaeta sp.]
MTKLFKGWNSRKWTTMGVGSGILLAAGFGIVEIEELWGQLATGLAGLTIVAETIKDAARELRRKPEEFDMASKMEAAKKALS